MSAIKSFLSSSPQEMRISPAGTPAAASCSSFICLCVEVAGFRQHVFASATWVSIAASLRFFVNYPTLPSNKYYETAKKYLPSGGCGVVSFELKGGRAAAEKFTNSTLSCCSRNSATACPFSTCLGIRT